MALIKPELTERDGWIKREEEGREKEKEEYEKQTVQKNRDSRTVHTIQITK